MIAINSKLKIIFLTIVLGASAACSRQSIHNDQIDLSGEWRFQIDSLNHGIIDKWYSTQLNDNILLPGTMDSNAKGDSCTLEAKLQKPQVLHLTRKYAYVGPAWYQRDIVIDDNMAGKPLSLELERVLWQSRLWIDSVEITPFQESLTTPHRFTIPGLDKGKHTLTLRIDNSKQHDTSVDNLAHSYTDATQVMWNGVLGQMTLQTIPEVNIESVQVYANSPSSPLITKVKVNNNTGNTVITEIVLDIEGKKHSEQITINPDINQFDLIWDITSYGYQSWNEFNPSVYNLTTSLPSYNVSKTVDFGFRDLQTQGNEILINGKPVFLRGTLECCIFPLTGTPPTDETGWEKVFKTAKEYGLNHIRFHSWCPPEAAFKVADKMGVYLQVELPQWSLTVGQDSLTTEFIYQEFERISTEYGNHPSFVMMTCGNELQPDFDTLNGLVQHMRNTDSRHLYAASSFTFEKGHGTLPEPNDQFFITQWTNNGWVRGQGVFDQQPPCFNKNYDESTQDINVPLVTHEIGQYSVYPNLTEIDKYTGSLLPLNFIAVKNDLEEKGLLAQAEQWTLASGKLAALLYKEEIERALKTQAISGFQLLDLHDFPGQGTALVGLLDAFWDSKGIITPQEFRQFCSPIVPLANFDKPIYTSGDQFLSDVYVANYSNDDILDAQIIWQLLDSTGNPIDTGSLDKVNIPAGGVSSIGNLAIDLNVAKAQKFIFDVVLSGTEAYNTWPIWVYPKLDNGDLQKLIEQIVVTDDFTTACSSLSKGEKVLFTPDYRSITGLEGKFVPVFWSPVHFPNQAGTMGLLCDPQHPALANFPTEMHTNWQWWDLLKHSTTVVIDSIPGAKPIVSQIDNFINNRHLSSIFEANCEKGQLIFSSIDLLGHNADADSPVRKQLLYSLLIYMTSPDFSPKSHVSKDEIKSLLSTK